MEGPEWKYQGSGRVRAHSDGSVKLVPQESGLIIFNKQNLPCLAPEGPEAQAILEDDPGPEACL